MIPSLVSTIFLFIFCPSLVSAGVQYKLVDQVVGTNFYDFFTWEAIQDPTHGRVWVSVLFLHVFALFSHCLSRQYVDQKTSKDLNLTFASTNTFILRADNTEYLNPSGPGRKSVRIQSKKQYTKHVAMWVFSFFLSTLHLEYNQTDIFWLADLTFAICQKVVRELRIVQKQVFCPGCWLFLLFWSTWPAIWEVTNSGWPVGVRMQVLFD